MELKLFIDSQKSSLDFHVNFKIENGEIVVFACDDEGDKIPGGNLLCIHEDGSIHRASSINRDLGLKLDGFGRLTICDL